MARALYPEEESAFDYKIVELDTSQRKCLNRKFYAAIFSVLLLLALGGTLLLRKTGVPAGTTPSIQNNYTVTSTDAIVRVDYNNAGEETSTVVNDANIKEWESYLRFEQAAPLEPVMPSQNAIFFQNYLPSYGNVSLHCEVHPKDRCLLILSRKMLTDDELADSTKFRACYGRLERNLRATYELYDIELGFLLPYCANIPLVPVMQKCKSPS